jgi:hypothetical protein
MVTLDMDKLESRITGSKTSEEALKDLSPFEWADSVLSGETQAVIILDEDGKLCVKSGT